MTIVFLVEWGFSAGGSGACRTERVLADRVGPNGQLAQGGEVAVLLVDDQQDIGSQQLDRFKLVEHQLGGLHPPLLDARRAGSSSAGCDWRPIRSARAAR